MFKHCHFFVKLEDLYGRSVIIHEDEDDLGHGNWTDSQTSRSFRCPNWVCINWSYCL
jgi:hypothetical protein